MTQGGYQVIIILPIKSKMAAAKNPGGTQYKSGYRMCRKHGSQNQAARYINGSLFFSKMRYMDGCACFNRYIDGPFFIIEVHRWAIFYHRYINASYFQ